MQEKSWNYLDCVNLQTKKNIGNNKHIQLSLIFILLTNMSLWIIKEDRKWSLNIKNCTIDRAIMLLVILWYTRNGVTMKM